MENIVGPVEKVHEFQAEVTRPGVHFGTVPGVEKPTLLKPGVECLGMVFRLDPEFELEQIRDGDHLTVIATCALYRVPTGAHLSSGLGSASTKESKYTWNTILEMATKRAHSRRPASSGFTVLAMSWVFWLTAAGSPFSGRYRPCRPNMASFASST